MFGLKIGCTWDGCTKHPVEEHSSPAVITTPVSSAMSQNEQEIESATRSLYFHLLLLSFCCLGSLVIIVIVILVLSVFPWCFSGFISRLEFLSYYFCVIMSVSISVHPIALSTWMLNFIENKDLQDNLNLWAVTAMRMEGTYHHCRFFIWVTNKQ